MLTFLVVGSIDASGSSSKKAVHVLGECTARTGTARNTVTGNSFSGCKDAVHVGGLTTGGFEAPGWGGRQAYGNVITDNNLCAGNSSVYLFDGEKRRQDNTIKGNS